MSFKDGFRMTRQDATASTIIRLAEKLEESTIAFYERVAKEFGKDQETYQCFIEESRESKKLVRRTYQETISDALEACFSFEGINFDEYSFDTKFPAGANYVNVLRTGSRLEDVATRFYANISEKSDSLLATITRAFRKAYDVHKKRKLKLENLISELEAK